MMKMPRPHYSLKSISILKVDDEVWRSLLISLKNGDDVWRSIISESHCYLKVDDDV